MTSTSERAPVRAADRRLAALWLACALGGLSQALGGSAGALLARQAGHSGSSAGLPQTMLVAGAALSALGLSRVAGRHGRGAALSLGALVAAVGCAVVVVGGLLAALPLILFGSLLMGAGNTTVMLGRYAAADLADESRRARAMSSVLLSTTVGAVLGPNLLAPAGALAVRLGLPVLTGPYLLAAAGLLATAGVLAAGLGVGTAAPRPGAAAGGSRPVGRDAATALVVLGAVNLVMVAVMTMAPVHLHHEGAGLGAIGFVVSLHIAGMFVPSRLSAWLTGRVGPHRVARLSATTLAVACLAAAVSPPGLLAVALALVGVGWNLGLVSGSVLLTAGTPAAARPGREGLGEAGMGAAAALGGAASGVLATARGYPTLAAATAVVALLLFPLLGWLARGGRGRRAPLLREPSPAASGAAATTE